MRPGKLLIDGIDGLVDVAYVAVGQSGLMGGLPGGGHRLLDSVDGFSIHMPLLRWLRAGGHYPALVGKDHCDGGGAARASAFTGSASGSSPNPWLPATASHRECC